MILGLMTEVKHTLTFYFTDFRVMMINKQLTIFFLRFPQSCPPPPLTKKKNQNIVDLQRCSHFRHIQRNSVIHKETFFFNFFSILGY